MKELSTGVIWLNFDLETVSLMAEGKGALIGESTVLSDTR